MNLDRRRFATERRDRRIFHHAHPVANKPDRICEADLAVQKSEHSKRRTGRKHSKKNLALRPLPERLITGVELKGPAVAVMKCLKSQPSIAVKLSTHLQYWDATVSADQAIQKRSGRLRGHHH